jgi:hypothetical protein
MGVCARGGDTMKEPYVKPTVKTEILKAEVLCNNGSAGGCGGCEFTGQGLFSWLSS